MESTKDCGRDTWVRTALERYEGPLMRYAVGIAGDVDQARDAVQETFLRLCQHSPELLEDHLAPWLFTVCRRRLIDVQRKENRMTALDDTQLARQLTPEPSPDEVAANRDASDRVGDILATLPPNQREVVRLKFQQQLSYQEIAEVTSLSVSNVGFLLHTALKTLRQRFVRLETPS